MSESKKILAVLEPNYDDSRWRVRIECIKLLASLVEHYKKLDYFKKYWEKMFLASLEDASS
jgi:hypothetical protein